MRGFCFAARQKSSRRPVNKSQMSTETLIRLSVFHHFFSPSLYMSLPRGSSLGELDEFCEC